MIGDVVETYIITTRAVTQKFVRKDQTGKVPDVTRSHVQKIKCQSCLFRLCLFAAQCLRSLHKKQRKNEQITVKQKPFSTIYNG